MAENRNYKKKNTAASRGRSTSSSTRKNSSRRSSTRPKTVSEPLDDAIKVEIGLLLIVAVCIVLFLSNFGVIGVFGNALRGFCFGVFGLIQYILPFAAIIFTLFRVFNKDNPMVTRKLIAGGILALLLMVICDLFTGQINVDVPYSISDVYSRCSEYRNGGGILGGSLAYLCVKYLSYAGTWVLMIVLVILCIILITGRSLFNPIREQGQVMYDESLEERRARKMEREEAAKERMALREERLAQKRELNDAREQERRLREEAKENEAILHSGKVKGVTFDTTLERRKQEDELPIRKTKDDEHKIKITSESDYEQLKDSSVVHHSNITAEGSDATREITASGYFEDNDFADYDSKVVEIVPEPEYKPEPKVEQRIEPQYEASPEPKAGNLPKDSYSVEYGNTMRNAGSEERPKAALKKESEETVQSQYKAPSPTSSYKFPPVGLLTEGKKGGKSSGEQELKNTADRLIQTLETFGVKAKITDVSRGPAVTRYELQPELGVKVSKIVGLTDDLKLSLAATDIRIEAPIPGKSAVGIEVPNKENEAVAFRELIESREFKESKASLPFAVGKDIGGQIIIHDIAKMPHVLIAGATGSGKSVCINTIVMSILYKCRPEDVRLILIDPKVVELSVYNPIPHLLLPVVTEPKKAAGALAWAVREMTDRYAKFADASVRDLKGYNASLEDPSQKLPHILIIVDELADLMMVAPGEVEESICRLAQLARACGIHLVIATQRPSVDVITGLIKANMPSRIAFAVSSGVDSRTILDMVGAEKLLGKGDMLFYPQGLPKPTRVQGAFVPDSDVSKVVDHFKKLEYVAGGTENIQDQVSAIQSSSGSSAGSSSDGNGGLEYDELFSQAGRFIIDKEKASIGALQRLLKIGFNRAARIMDQLAEAGVVGEEQGTKPREILMNAEQFEELLQTLGMN